MLDDTDALGLLLKGRNEAPEITDVVKAHRFDGHLNVYVAGRKSREMSIATFP